MTQKIAIITRENAIANLTINQIIPSMIAMEYKPVIFVTPDPYIKGLDIPELKRCSFIETGMFRDVVVPYLNNNPLHADHQPLDKVNYTYDQLADFYGFDVVDLEDVNAPEFVELVKNDRELIGGVSIRSALLYKNPILDAFQNKPDGFFWNLHPAVLPQYKGLCTLFRAAHNNEKLVGQTLHNLDSGIDTGSIIDIQCIVFDRGKPLFETYVDLADTGAQLVNKSLRELKDIGLPYATVQSDEEKNLYCHLPNMQELEDMRNEGIVFADENTVSKLYADKYSRPGTAHAAGLSTVIEKSLHMGDASYENEPTL